MLSWQFPSMHTRFPFQRSAVHLVLRLSCRIQGVIGQTIVVKCAFPSKGFIASACRFRSLMFQLIFAAGRGDRSSFLLLHAAVPAPFVARTVLSPLSGLGALVETRVSVSGTLPSGLSAASRGLSVLGRATRGWSQQLRGVEIRKWEPPLRSLWVPWAPGESV